MESSVSYLAPPLLLAVVTLSLTIFVWRYGQTGRSSKIFALFLMSIGLWGGITFGMRSSPDVHQAVIWDRALGSAVYLSYVLYYHFTAAYTDRKGRRTILAIAYGLVPIACALAPTDLIVKSMRIEPYGYAPNTGPLAPILGLASFILIGAGAYNLLQYYRTNRTFEERNRTIYLLLAVPLPLAGGMLDAFTNLPPASVWANLVFCTTCSIAILKYHLLDIRMVIRNSLVYILLSSTIAIPYVAIVYALRYILELALEPWWPHAIIVLLLAVLLRPVYTQAQHLVDRLFYRDRYDQLAALQRFIADTQSTDNLEDLSSRLVTLVKGVLLSHSACLLLPNEDTDAFVLVACVGVDNTNCSVAIRQRGLLVKWLRQNRRILFSKELAVFTELQNLTRVERASLENLSAELVVPIMTRYGNLVAVLIVGPKLSRQDYSPEDKQLLSMVSSQMAAVLESARLYHDTVRMRKNLESWLNSMSDCVVIVDSHRSIEFMNRAAINRFGDQRGQVCWRVIGESVECEACPVNAKAAQNVKTVSPVRSIGEHEYDVAAGNLETSQGGRSVIEVLRDVTERRELEKKEKQMESELNLSRRLAAIGELTAGIAHEINNPLTGILGFAERLLRRTTDLTVSNYLKIIYQEAERAATVIQNLRTFARHHQSRKEHIYMNDVIKKALELRLYELRSSNIQVVTELATNLNPIWADFHQLQQVFLNLIMNAEQALVEKGGEKKLVIRTEGLNHFQRVAFVDNGIGIKPEYLDKVFDPFFTTKGEKGGTGLGLSISHGIIAEHGGRIYVKSDLGEGASFFVEFPNI